MRISTRRAKCLRRGIVSGQILVKQLEEMFQDRPVDVFIYWAALKIRAYVSETESFTESEALYRTVLPVLNRLLDKENVKLVLHYAALLRVLP